MSTNVGSMIDEVLGQLEGWSLDEEQSTTLATDFDDAANTFTITSARGIATGLSPGIVEIEQELLYCDSITGTNVSIVPWGRGYKNTTASAHSAGARVISQPTFPRSKVLDSMNQVLQRIFPDVFAVKSIELTTTVPQINYQLPDNAEKVLQMWWSVPGPTGEWRAVRRWRMRPGGGTQLGDTGKTVDIADSMVPGRTLQIIYMAQPTAMTAEDQIFADQTGLTESLRDVVTLGAAVRQVSSQELSRLQVSSVEQQNRSGLVAPSAALTSSRFLEQVFQERLAEERKSLIQLYPPRITGAWQ